MSNILPYENLVLAVLAFRDGYIDRGQLEKWLDRVKGKGSPSVGAWLVEQGCATPAQVSLLEEHLREFLAEHGGDAQASLASLCDSNGEVREVSSGFLPDLQQLTPGLMATVSAAGSGSRPVTPPDPAAPGAGHELRAESATWSAAADPARELRRESTNRDTSSGPQSPLAGDRFRVLSLHDQGGLGQVMLARDEQIGRTVALKEIRPDRADDPENQVRFVAEGEITGGLEHPGIVPVYALGRYPDQRPYYVMRFIRGSHLGKAIDAFHQQVAPGLKDDQWLLEMHKLLRRFIDVCNAVGYAHSRGVLHRDLKPGNVMLGKFGETLVVDWGLAKIVGRTEEASATEEVTLRISAGSGSYATLAGSKMGTPAYMSPEQAAGDLDTLGPASDVYSLGATLHCLLTGKPPFSAGRDILERVQRGEFEPPRKLKPETPKPLEAICLKAMARLPADRYASPAELVEDLECWMADRPVGAYRESRVERLARWMRRHRTGVRAAVLALAAIAMVSSVAMVVVVRTWQREAAAWNQASANFVQAREAVDRWLTGAGDALSYYPAANRARSVLLEQAAEEYERFVRQEHADPKLELERGRTYLRLGHLRLMLRDATRATAAYRQAEAVFAGLLTRNGDDVWGLLERANCQTNLGAVAMETGQLTQARDHLRIAINQLRQLAERYPEMVAVREGLAAALINLGELLADDGGSLDEAERVLRDALFQLADDGASRNASSGDAQHTIRRLQQRADAHDLLGRVLLDRGNYEQGLAEIQAAIRIADQLIAHEPDNPRHWQWRAVGQVYLVDALRVLGRADEEAAASRQAIETYRQLCTALPGVASFEASLAITQLNHGNLLVQLGSIAEAEAELTEARVLAERLALQHPDFPAYRDAQAGCLALLGELLRDRGETQQAETLMRAAIRIFEDLISGAAGDGEQAPAGYRESLAVCRCHLARLLGRADQHDEAEATFRAALEGLAPLAPGSPRSQDRLADVYRYRGTWLHERGQREEAAIEFRRALDLWLGLATAPLAAAEHRARFAWFLVNCAQPEFHDPRAASRLAAGLTAEVPQNPEYWSLLGAAQVRDGQYEQAAVALKRAISLRRSDHAREEFFLALTYAKTGRMDEANEAYARAAEWLEKNLPQHDELRRLQHEAAAVLEAARSETDGGHPDVVSSS
jgi:eukaryotic-like serine/threonine-protein kinase